MGLASVVFALLAVEEIGTQGDVAPAIATVAFTILLSVLLHGLSAGPLAVLYARTEQDHDKPGDAPLARRSSSESPDQLAGSPAPDEAD